jgi:hypothetical protein
MSPHHRFQSYFCTPNRPILGRCAMNIRLQSMFRTPALSRNLDIFAQTRKITIEPTNANRVETENSTVPSPPRWPHCDHLLPLPSTFPSPDPSPSHYHPSFFPTTDRPLPSSRQAKTPLFASKTHSGTPSQPSVNLYSAKCPKSCRLLGHFLHHTTQHQLSYACALLPSPF